MKRYSLLAFLLCLGLHAPMAQTLDECYEAAERNYPLIKRYDLIGKTNALDVKDIAKGWLPQVTASAQVTYQSDVTSWPDQMKQMLAGMGIDFKGLRRDQYRVALDIQQTLYDGVAMKSRQEVVRRMGEVEEAQNAVSLHAIRQRVCEMYFGVLMLDEQLVLNRDLQRLLQGNEDKLEAMYRRGTAAESDFLSVRAERLVAMQVQTNLENQRETLVRLLSLFCGRETTNPFQPPLKGETNSLPHREGWGGPLRPELKAIDSQLRLADAQEKVLRSALMPRLGLFAQGYYGYPGYNLFEDMMRHRWSLNGMVGVRLSWNIGALYTRKNDRARLQLQRETAVNNRDVFLFNNKLEQVQEDEEILRYRKLMADDDEIIALRQNVRKAAESKLQHGIIDTNDLVREINAENAARVSRSMHELEMLHQVYNQRITINE
ncbi:MAG: TolC family protein [Bacteroidaceae bacterium]|nr:TolC family protein [Bacteroidaceae bacterium]